jgi:hypothetical protein
MSFSGKKPFGWQNSIPSSDGLRSSSRLSKTFSAQSRRFFGFVPMSEERVLTSLQQRLQSSKPMKIDKLSSKTKPESHSEIERHLPKLTTGSPITFSKCNVKIVSPNYSVIKPRLSPPRALSSNLSFSPYSPPKRSSSSFHHSQSPKANSCREYLGGIPDLVQLNSHDSILDAEDFPTVFPDFHRLLTSSTQIHDSRSDTRLSMLEQRRNNNNSKTEDFSCNFKDHRRIRFDDNVQSISSDCRPPSSSDGTELSTVYIIEDVESSECSDIEDDSSFEYNPDRERISLAFRLRVLPDHSDLLWIVDECILESSKDPWQPCFSKKSLLYHNRVTGEV